MKWYSELISNKYNSTGENQKKRGRKQISKKIVDEIIRLANSNPTWGYDRIAGVMKYLDYDVSATTVRNVLDAHGIVPDPERRRRNSRDFISRRSAPRLPPGKASSVISTQSIPTY